MVTKSYMARSGTASPERKLTNLSYNADPNYPCQNGYKVYSSWSIGAKELDSTKVNWQDISEEKIGFRFMNKTRMNGNALGQYKFPVSKTKNRNLSPWYAVQNIWFPRRRSKRLVQLRTTREIQLNLPRRGSTKGSKQLIGNDPKRWKKTKVTPLFLYLPTFPGLFGLFHLVTNANGHAGIPPIDNLWKKTPLWKKQWDTLCCSALENSNLTRFCPIPKTHKKKNL